jgi:hypothetical protein
MTTLVDDPRGVANKAKSQRATNVEAGNPGEFLGAEIIQGIPHARYRAQKGTWVSASLKELGYGRHYGTEVALGAYLGMALGVDGKPIPNPDRIEPGQDYFIPFPPSPESAPLPRRAASWLRPTAESESPRSEPQQPSQLPGDVPAGAAKKASLGAITSALEPGTAGQSIDEINRAFEVEIGGDQPKPTWATMASLGDIVSALEPGTAGQSIDEINRAFEAEIGSEQLPKPSAAEWMRGRYSPSLEEQAHIGGTIRFLLYLNPVSMGSPEMIQRTEEKIDELLPFSYPPEQYERAKILEQAWALFLEEGLWAGAGAIESAEKIPEIIARLEAAQVRRAIRTASRFEAARIAWRTGSQLPEELPAAKQSNWLQWRLTSNTPGQSVSLPPIAGPVSSSNVAGEVTTSRAVTAGQPRVTVSSVPTRSVSSKTIEARLAALNKDLAAPMLSDRIATAKQLVRELEEKVERALADRLPVVVDKLEETGQLKGDTELSKGLVDAIVKISRSKDPKEGIRALARRLPETNLPGESLGLGEEAALALRRLPEARKNVGNLKKQLRRLTGT